MNSLPAMLRSPLLSLILVLAPAAACSPGYTSPYSGQSYQSPYVRATQDSADPSTESTESTETARPATTDGETVEPRPARSFPRNEKDTRRRRELRDERPTGARDSRREAPGPMSDADFASLVAAVEEAPFKDGKLDIVRAAAATSHFTTDQAARLVALMPFGETQADAAVMLYPRLTDPQNSHRLFAALRFDSDRRNVMQRLGLTAR